MPKPAFSNNSTPLASINDFDVAEIGSTIAPLAKDELMMRLVDGSAETVFRSEDVAGTAYDFVEITLNNPTAFGQVVEVGIIGANLWINALIKNNTDPAINGPAGHALLNGANDTAMWVRFFCESVADGWSAGMMGSQVIQPTAVPDTTDIINSTGSALAISDAVTTEDFYEIDEAPTFSSIAATHKGKSLSLINVSGGPITLPTDPKVNAAKLTFENNEALLVLVSGLDSYYVVGGSS